MLDKRWQSLTPPNYQARSARTVGELFLRRADVDGPRIAFKQRRAGRWEATTWRQFHERSAAIAGFLIDRGLEPGDKLCVVGGTCPEWCYADIAGHLAGAVTLGAYPTLTAKQLAYILDHADTRFAIVQGQVEVDKLIESRDALPKLDCVLVWNTDGLDDALADHDWLVPLTDALAVKPDFQLIEKRAEAVDPDTTAIIVYTSGTTGPPKGAMISHRNIITCLAEYEGTMTLDRDDMGFTFLPMAHVAERVAGFYGRINSGMVTCFATSIPKVLEELKQVKPTVFGSVPRIFEKAYARIMSEVEKAPSGKQKVFRWAERVGRQRVQHWQRGEPAPLMLRLQYKLADRLVFSKLREVFGGRVRQFVTGAAPIADEILEFFWAAGFAIFEVYGMTEATVISHSNRPGEVRLGSVGKVLPFIEEKIADDGEILLRGPSVFQGYYKDPEATRAAVDEDGWLHTGDIGERDEDGFLYIRDRKKHIIITAGGKNLTPANIENELKASDPLISQAHAHGDKRAYLTAIVTIGPGEAVEYARQSGMLGDADAQRIITALMENPLSQPDGLADVMKQVTDQPALRERITRSVKRANAQLSRVETIKKVYLLEREFSLDQDEMTPTLKVKRKNIETKFAEVFDRLYSDESFGLVIESQG